MCLTVGERPSVCIRLQLVLEGDVLVSNGPLSIAYVQKWADVITKSASADSLLIGHIINYCILIFRLLNT